MNCVCPDNSIKYYVSFLGNYILRVGDHLWMINRTTAELVPILGETNNSDRELEFEQLPEDIQQIIVEDSLAYGG